MTHYVQVNSKPAQLHLELWTIGQISSQASLQIKADHINIHRNIVQIKAIRKLTLIFFSAKAYALQEPDI